MAWLLVTRLWCGLEKTLYGILTSRNKDGDFLKIVLSIQSTIIRQKPLDRSSYTCYLYYVLYKINLHGFIVDGMGPLCHPACH